MSNYLAILSGLLYLTVMQPYKLGLVLALVFFQVILALLLAGGLPGEWITVWSTVSGESATVEARPTPRSSPTAAKVQERATATRTAIPTAAVRVARGAHPTYTPPIVDSEAFPTSTPHVADTETSPTHTPHVADSEPLPTATPLRAETPVSPEADIDPESPAPMLTVMVVGGTGNLGLNLRREPSTNAETIRGLLEGSTLVVIGPIVESDGFEWVNVQDQFGNVGWVPVQYLLAPQPMSPIPTDLSERWASTFGLKPRPAYRADC